MANKKMELPENFRFFPEEQFEWKEKGTTYFPGNGYNCTSEDRHAELREKCAEWLAAGKIKITVVAGFTTVRVN